MNTPNITWDLGTAYDLFASLHVLHHPARFGLRASWAAGVRSRLSSAQRQVLEEAQELFRTPVAWLYRLPQPKEAASALRTLEQLSPEDRLPALAELPGTNADSVPGPVSQAEQAYKKVLRDVYERRSWNEADLEALREAHQQSDRPITPRLLVNSLEWWSRPDVFGENYLAALQAYHAVFFREEEQRIRPVLESALVAAQKLAQHVDFSLLVETLSQGVQIAILQEAAQVILAPSYWITPLVFYDQVSPGCMALLFGARPPDETLVPGEMIPDALLLSLKALSDPTRLRILRYLVDQPMTPSQLSRRLRLRNPTMTHHLNALRLAGLVRLLVDENGERCYAVRSEAITDTYNGLTRFLEVK